MTVTALTWTADDAFELGDTTFVCRPLEGRFHSEPSRFCLLKPRRDVEWYESFLRELAPQRIVEVGVFDGGSSALFAELVRPEKLVAIDRRPEPSAAFTEFIERRGFGDVIAPFFGVDQSDVSRLAEIVAGSFGDAELDLVVDDASHLLGPTRATFNCLFPRLRPGGTYVIEDWSWSLPDEVESAPPEPLTRLVFELVLACTSRPKIVASVEVVRTYVIVKRGLRDLDPEGFDLARCISARGAALLPES